MIDDDRPIDPAPSTEADRGASREPGAGIPHGEDDVRLLARLIYAEGGEDYRLPDALEGIGWTVRNRIGAPGFPRSLAGVVFQQGRNGTFQYTGVSSRQWARAEDPSSLKGAERDAYSRALDVATGILDGSIADPTGGATYFHSLGDDTPPWFRSRQDAGVLQPLAQPRPGKLRFYRERR